MSEVITPKEVVLRVLRWHFGLQPETPAIALFEICAHELGIPMACIMARADHDGMDFQARGFFPSYVQNIYNSALERQSRELVG